MVRVNVTGPELSMDVECEFSGLPEATCAHCNSLDSVDIQGPEDPEYIVVRVFEAQYKGSCRLDYDHRIKLGDKVGKLERIDNPFIPVTGVACAKCTQLLPRQH